jgi:hypothetical protein
MVYEDKGILAMFMFRCEICKKACFSIRKLYMTILLLLVQCNMFIDIPSYASNLF